MSALRGIADIPERLILGVLSRSPNVRNAPKEDNCYISLFKTKTHHPCRQTRIFSKSLKVLRPVGFIFQINSTRQPAHKKVDSPRGLPPEGRPSVVLFYERFPSRRQLLREGTLNPEVCPLPR